MQQGLHTGKPPSAWRNGKTRLQLGLLPKEKVSWEGDQEWGTVYTKNYLQLSAGLQHWQELSEFCSTVKMDCKRKKNPQGRFPLLQDLTKILPASARQHLLHKPRAHLCGTAEICSIIHKMPRDSASRGREAAGHSRGWGTELQPWGPRAQPGMFGRWGVGRQHERESETNSSLFPSCHGPRRFDLVLLVTLIWWMSQRNPWLQDLAEWIKGVVLGAHLKCIWWKERWQELGLQCLSHIPRASEPRCSLRLCLTQKPSPCSGFVLISQWQRVQNKTFLVLENQHHIFTSGNNDNVSNSFSGFFSFFSLWLEICQYVGGWFSAF